MIKSKITRKVFVGGELISDKQFKKIKEGKTDKHFYCRGNELFPLLKLKDHINVIGDRLDENDQLLLQALSLIELPLSDTLIIMVYGAPPVPIDPLFDIKGEIYGYY